MMVHRKDGRVCAVVPPRTPKDVLPERKYVQQIEDDAVDGMGFYENGGAVVTWCNQFALYNRALPQGTGIITCLECIAHRRNL